MSSGAAAAAKEATECLDGALPFDQLLDDDSELKGSVKWARDTPQCSPCMFFDDANAMYPAVPFAARDGGVLLALPLDVGRTGDLSSCAHRVCEVRVRQRGARQAGKACQISLLDVPTSLLDRIVLPTAEPVFEAPFAFLGEVPTAWPRSDDLVKAVAEWAKEHAEAAFYTAGEETVPARRAPAKGDVALLETRRIDAR